MSQGGGLVLIKFLAERAHWSASLEHAGGEVLRRGHRSRDTERHLRRHLLQSTGNSEPRRLGAVSATGTHGGEGMFKNGGDGVGL